MRLRWKLLSLCCAAALAAGFGGLGAGTAYADTGNTAGAAAETIPAKTAPTEFAHIYECYISGDQVVLDGQMEGTFSDPNYYDNYLYLFEQKPYQRFPPG